MPIVVSYPEFTIHEAAQMISSNASRADFGHVVSYMKKGLVNSTTYITHRVVFDQVKDEFVNWLKPEFGVMKAIVCMS